MEGLGAPGTPKVLDVPATQAAGGAVQPLHLPARRHGGHARPSKEACLYLLIEQELGACYQKYGTADTLRQPGVST